MIVRRCSHCLPRDVLLQMSTTCMSVYATLGRLIRMSHVQKNSTQGRVLAPVYKLTVSSR